MHRNRTVVTVEYLRFRLTSSDIVTDVLHILRPTSESGMQSQSASLWHFSQSKWSLSRRHRTSGRQYSES